MSTVARPPGRPPTCAPHRSLPSPSAAARATCKQPSLLLPPVSQSILRWAIIIATTSLLMLAFSISLRKAAARAVTSLLPITPLQQLPANFPLMRLLACLPGCVTMLILAAALSTAPLSGQHLQWRRSQLLAAARLLPKAVGLLQLLLLPTHPVGHLHWVTMQPGAAGAKGLLTILVWPLLFPVRKRCPGLQYSSTHVFVL
jgi:hypothetical protein